MLKVFSGALGYGTGRPAPRGPAAGLTSTRGTNTSLTAATFADGPQGLGWGVWVGRQAESCSQGERVRARAQNAPGYPICSIEVSTTAVPGAGALAIELNTSRLPDERR